MGTVDSDIYVVKTNGGSLRMHTYWESWSPEKIEVIFIYDTGDDYETFSGGIVKGSIEDEEPSEEEVIKKMLPKFNRILKRIKKKEQLNKKKK